MEVDSFSLCIFVFGMCGFVGVLSPSSSSTASSTSPAVVAVGQVGSYGYGSVTMEKSFRVSYILL